MGYSKLESVFENYSASQAAVQDIWSVGLAGSGGDWSIPDEDTFLFSNRTKSYIDPLDVTSVSTDTVSPKELLSAETSVLSAFEEGDESPLFDDVETVSDEWPSLFEDNVESKEEEMVKQVKEIEPVKSPLLSPKRETSLSPILTGASVTKHSKKRDSVDSGYKKDALGITVYSRKPRSQPLQPITIPEDGDSLTAKRARNTEAARRSRARKLERMSQLEERLHELVKVNEDLQSEIERLRVKCGEA